MKERPILFSGPMVRALLDGNKTQTRRIAKNQPPAGVASIRVARYHPTVIRRNGDEEPGAEIFGAYSDDGAWGCKCPYGEPGDRLWVRETWQGPLLDEDRANEYWSGNVVEFEKPEFCVYAADGGGAPEFVTSDDEMVCRWRPSIHMPRWASRISLEITHVRFECVHDITDADALAEGVSRTNASIPGYPRDRFVRLWTSINGNESWSADPWVWVVEFKRIEA